MQDTPPARADSSSSPLNILILYTDQQRWDALGANGNPDIQTPHLDRLARESINFDHCFVQNPLCMPSRVSFLTGRYPSALGITHMGVPVPQEMDTIATYFGRGGYRTANLGKLHFLPHANRDHTRPHPPYGFHHLEISDEPGVYEDAYRAWVRHRNPNELKHLSAGLPPERATWLKTMGWVDPVPHPASGARSDFQGPVPFPGRSDCTHSAFVGTRTCEYLERRALSTDPFLLISGFYSPHAPWMVPQEYLDRYQPDSFGLPAIPDPPGQAAFRRPGDDHLRRARHGYYAMVSEVDDQVGRILDTLEKTGLAETTLVVFTSDHGEWLGEHGRWGKGYPAHDACSRVPLLIRVPQEWTGQSAVSGRLCQEVVEAVDILPTLLEAAGLPVSSLIQGRSLLPLCRGESCQWRGSALTQHDGWRSLRTLHHRYVVQSTGEEMLFDLKTDPGGYINLSKESASHSLLADLRHTLIQRELQTSQPLDRIWPY